MITNQPQAGKRDGRQSGQFSKPPGNLPDLAGRMRSLQIRTWTVVLLLMAAGAVWAVVNGTGHKPAPPLPPPPAGIAQVPAPAPPGLVIANVAGPLETVLADLRESDRTDREAWVAAGYSSDLQALISLTDNADGTSPLNVNALVLSTDAYAYLAANSPRLQPGWQAEYATVRADLNRLAADSGLAPVPAPPDSAGLSAKPDTTLPWQPPAQSASAGSSCTVTGTTVTNSSSSTGAHSQSVKTAATCGSVKTAVTNKTSVSKTGVVTNTTTTANTAAAVSTSGSASGG
jgi:hypothetical protein